MKLEQDNETIRLQEDIYLWETYVIRTETKSLREYIKLNKRIKKFYEKGQNRPGKKAIIPLDATLRHHIMNKRKDDLVNDWKETKPIQDKAIGKAIAQANEHTL